MDALSEVLRLVRLTGAVFLKAEFTAPWAVASPPSHVLAGSLLPHADHFVEYHLVVKEAVSSGFREASRSRSKRATWSCCLAAIRIT